MAKEQTTDEQIKDLAHAHAAHTGLKMSTLGAYAANDGKFFKHLDEGRECRRRTREKVANWFAQNWPEDLEWPSDIPRPIAADPKRGAA